MRHDRRETEPGDDSQFRKRPARNDRGVYNSSMLDPEACYSALTAHDRRFDGRYDYFSRHDDASVDDYRDGYHHGRHDTRYYNGRDDHRVRDDYPGSSGAYFRQGYGNKYRGL